MQPIYRMNYGHCLHFGEVLRGQGPFAWSDELHCQSFKDYLCQFSSNAAPHTTTKRHVAEPRFTAFIPLRTKPVWIKQLWALKDRCGLMCVPDTVHHTPAFGDLEALSKIKRNQISNIRLNFKWYIWHIFWAHTQTRNSRGCCLWFMLVSKAESGTPLCTFTL